MTLKKYTEKVTHCFKHSGVIVKAEALIKKNRRA
jgi:hypothetical protein